jgi:hypothetical protein
MAVRPGVVNNGQYSQRTNNARAVPPQSINRERSIRRAAAGPGPSDGDSPRGGPVTDDR